MPDSAGKSVSRFETLLVAFLFFATLLVYSPAGRHEFLNYDDPGYVTENGYVKKGLTAEGIRWAFTALHDFDTFWHPITWISHMTDVQLFGVRAPCHHWTNVLLHAINAVLLFALLKGITQQPRASWVVAALFALHPLQVESVAWVAERKNVLSGTFWLLTLLAYIAYVRRRPGFDVA